MLSNFDGLARGRVLFEKRVLFQSSLEGRFVDQDSAVISIVDQVLAREGVTRVEELAVLFALDQACVRLRTVVHLNSKHSVDSALLL